MVFDQSAVFASLQSKKCFVFDLDGTVYLGNRVFPFAIDFIGHLRGHGYRVLFFTNNASRSKKTYLKRLSDMGFAPAEDEVLTSGNVTETYIKTRYPGKTVYLLGTDDLRDEFLSEGISLVYEDAPAADVAVLSFDLSLTYEKVFAFCKFVRQGAVYLATHPDPNCPSERGPLPDAGSFISLVETSTGRKPLVFGKPEAPAADMICEMTGLSKKDICVIGDRLLTDIGIGARNGIDSILVETGANTATDAAELPEALRPTFIFPSLLEVDQLMFP